MKPKTPACWAELTLNVVGGRWKVPILFHLADGPMRFSELKRTIEGVTQKMLTQQLREMERDGIVSRKIFAQIPPRVEYSLTPIGKSLKPVVEAMCHWGKTRGCRIKKPE